jgi:hypothetical protein
MTYTETFGDTSLEITVDQTDDGWHFEAKDSLGYHIVGGSWETDESDEIAVAHAINREFLKIVGW